MTPSQLRAFVLWARRGVVVQGGRLIDHLGLLGHPEADGILLEAAELGWIRRGAYEPTRELRFFGIGGRDIGNRTAPPADAVSDAGVLLCRAWHPVEYSWEVSLSAPMDCEGVAPFGEVGFFQSHRDCALCAWPVAVHPEATERERELLGWAPGSRRDYTICPGQDVEAIVASQARLRELELEWVERTKREREQATIDMARQFTDGLERGLLATPRQDINRTRQAELDLVAPPARARRRR